MGPSNRGASGSEGRDPLPEGRHERSVNLRGEDRSAKSTRTSHLERYGRLVQTCDAFEIAWREGRQPQIEPYLESVPTADRPSLLFELVALERELKKGKGDSTDPALYQARFPEHAEIVQAVFATPLVSHAGHAADEPRVTAPPGYKILNELGRGGMGVVYKAIQVGLNRTVALKMILAGAHAGPDARTRFATEAEAVARLQHPGIVQIHEVGEHEGRPYQALEFVSGGSLSQRIGGQPLPFRRAAELVEELARGIQAAHHRGVVHRDLKPANILLTAEGLPKIADFGLAKLVVGSAAGRTHSGILMGTPSYMAPEQAGGHPKGIGPACDIHALGAILYESLTGRPPYRGETLLETLDQVRSVEPEPPRRLRPRLPRDLETICLKCLRKDPDARYSTAEELAEDLHAFLAGQPIQARRPGRFERTVRAVRRRPATTAAIAAFGGAMILGLSIGAWRQDAVAVAVATVLGPARGWLVVRLPAPRGARPARPRARRLRAAR